MGIVLEWENGQHTIIRWTFSGAWTWDDFEAAQREFHAMLNTVDHNVDVIADLRQSQLLPKDTFANFKRLERAKELAAKKNVLPINIALAYVLCQPFPTFPLIGPRTLEETRTSFPALDVDLTPEEVRWLNLED